MPSYDAFLKHVDTICNLIFSFQTKLNFCSDIWKGNDYDEKQKQKPIEEEVTGMTKLD
jgi:hypothetical protein